MGAGTKQLIVMTVALAALLAAATAAATPPGKLYQALLTSDFSPLPSGFFDAKVGSDSLDARDKAHHAVGRVLVTIDSDAGVSYAIFPTARDAAGRLAEKPSGTSDIKLVHVQSHGRAPGFRHSRWYNVTIEGKNALGKTVRNGLTVMCAQVGQVQVCGETLSIDNEVSGDVPGTLRLLRAGVTHLNRVTAGVH
jgi:hypothetical protein